MQWIYWKHKSERNMYARQKCWVHFLPMYHTMKNLTKNQTVWSRLCMEALRTWDPCVLLQRIMSIIGPLCYPLDAMLLDLPVPAWCPANDQARQVHQCSPFFWDFTGRIAISSTQGEPSYNYTMAWDAFYSILFPHIHPKPSYFINVNLFIY